MTERQERFKLERTFAPLVDLSDALAKARLHAAKIKLKQAKLHLKRERCVLIPDRQTLDDRAELSRRISGLADRLRENRVRIGRIRSRRQRELGVLLGADFSYESIVSKTTEFSMYAGYFGGDSER